MILRRITKGGVTGVTKIRVFAGQRPFSRFQPNPRSRRSNGSRSRGALADAGGVLPLANPLDQFQNRVFGNPLTRAFTTPETPHFAVEALEAPGVGGYPGKAVGRLRTALSPYSLQEGRPEPRRTMAPPLDAATTKGPDPASVQLTPGRGPLFHPPPCVTRRSELIVTSSSGLSSVPNHRRGPKSRLPFGRPRFPGSGTGRPSFR